MPFPTKLLNEDETVVLDLRPHWSRLFWPVLLVVVAIAATAGVAIGTDSKPLALVFVVLLALAVLNLLARYAKWTTTNFVVTDQRLIHREGVVSKQGIEIPLDRVQTVKFHQSAFERLLGAGDLLIESAGETGQNSFSDIRRPNVVQNVIYREMEAYENRRADRMAGARQPAGPASVAEEIAKLDALVKSGALTPEEFAVQKARLLGS